jgi:hypothetical protein
MYVCMYVCIRVSVVYEPMAMKEERAMMQARMTRLPEM